MVSSSSLWSLVVVASISVSVMLVIISGVDAIPSFDGGYSVYLQTRDYDRYGYCSIDQHIEYVSNPKFGLTVDSYDTASLARYDTGYYYSYTWSSKSGCSRDTIPIDDYPNAGLYLGDWLDSGSTMRSTQYLTTDYYSSQYVQVWDSDRTWYDATYVLYVTPAGIPLREEGCVMDAALGYYAYVTDFNRYNGTRPDVSQFFAVPGSCPSSLTINNNNHYENDGNGKVSMPRVKGHGRRVPRVNGHPFTSSSSRSSSSAAVQASCSATSYSTLCAVLRARQAGGGDGGGGGSSSSVVNGAGFQTGITIAILFLAAVWVYIRRQQRLRRMEEADMYELEVVPIVPFRYESDGKEEKRPEGPQLFREALPCRDDWRGRCAAIDFTYSMHDSGKVYWDESGAYRLTQFAARELERATRELHGRCMDVVARAITSDEIMLRLGISSAMFPSIRKSWENKEPSIYGRFDFIYDGLSAPKMLEYNADTPTVIIESGIAQRTWLMDMQASGRLLNTFGQFNELEESLTGQWREIQNELKQLAVTAAATSGTINVAPGTILHMVCVRDHEEDGKTMAAMAGYARQAGFDVRPMYIDEMNWNDAANKFVDSTGTPITLCWKLYPFEWMASDSLDHLALGDTKWVEPAWKMIMSSKGILPLLWEMFPGHPNLLAASWNEVDAQRWGTRYVSKPLQGREGQMTTIKEANGSPVYSRGANANDTDITRIQGVGATMVYQQYVESPAMQAIIPPAGPPKPGYMPPKEDPPVPLPTSANVPPMMTSTPVAAATPYSPYAPMAIQMTPMIGVGYQAVPSSPYPVDAPPSYETVTATQPLQPVHITIGPSSPISMNIHATGAPMMLSTMSGFEAAPTVAAPPVTIVRPVFGSWVVGGQPAGIVIREDSVLVTNNESRIVPHYVDGMFHTTPPVVEVPVGERDEEPGADVGTTTIYTGYRLGHVYRRSTYWYPMSYSQICYYRMHRGPGHIGIGGHRHRVSRHYRVGRRAGHGFGGFGHGGHGHFGGGG